MKRPAFVFQRQALRNPRREHPVTALRFVLLLSYFFPSRVDPDGLGRFLRGKDLPKVLLDLDLVFLALAKRCTPSLSNHKVPRLLILCSLTSSLFL